MGKASSVLPVDLLPPGKWGREWWVLLETKDKMNGWWGRGKTPQDAMAAARAMVRKEMASER